MPDNPFEEFKKEMTREEKESVENLFVIVRDFEEKGFGFQNAGNSIHSIGARRFVLTYGKTSPQVAQYLYKGYSLNLKKKNLKPRYEEQNNKSARQDLDFVREKIKEWEGKGRLHRVYTKPACVNPLTVAQKFDPVEKKIKKRLVLDCSRYVNYLVQDESVKPNDLTYFESFFERDGYMSTWDLSSMYHHLNLEDEAKEYFGFMVPNSDSGEPEYYIMDVLPFGFGPAMAVMNEILSPTLNFVRRQGINVGCFVDDGAVVHKNPYVAFVQAWFCRIVLQCAGWNLSWDKCEIVPGQVITYQGFIVDQTKMEYRLAEEKRQYICQLAKELIEYASSGRPVQARDWAGVIGKMVACRRSHGQAMAIGLRYSQNLLGRAVMHRGPDFDPDWDTSVHLNGQAIREMAYVTHRLETSNGHSFPIRKEFEILNRTGELFKPEEGLRSEQEQYQVIASDASDKVAFVYEAGQFRMVENFFFDETEGALSSGHRELLAIKKTLTAKQEYFRNSEKRVFWITDSQNVYYFMKRGSAKEAIQEDILSIKEKEEELGIYLTVIWAPRETTTISWADAGSRMHKSTDEWSIDRNTYFKIIKTVGVEPTVDGFATRINRKCDRFYSKFPQLHAEGVDFFAQELSQKEVYWLCPPPTRLAEVLRHLENQKFPIEAYISFPDWPSGNFWPMLIKGKYFRPEVATAFYSRPCYISHNWEKSIFRGYKGFRFITVYTVWKGAQHRVPYQNE